MKAITITREYGAGGGEVARRLAEALDWELLDRQLLHKAAEIEHVPDAELERFDEKDVAFPKWFHVHPPHQKYRHGLKSAVDEAVRQGKVVLVGRGARHLLGETAGVLHVRLVAPKPWRAQRMAELEGWPLDTAFARCTEIDRMRERFTRYFFGEKASQPAEYDLVFNTQRVLLDDVAATVAAIVREDFTTADDRSTGRKVVTLSRELGAGETGFAPTLAQRMKLKVYDRELLEQETLRLGVAEAEIEKIDEQRAGVLQRFQPGSIHRRYFEAMCQIMHELAERGDVILVGRGGSQILKDDPQAFHVRLVAPLPVRVRRVMEYRWVQEGVAKKLIAHCDSQRSDFYQGCFGADWSSPLEYDLTVNTGRLGPTAIEIVAAAAARAWRQESQNAGAEDPHTNPNR